MTTRKFMSRKTKKSARTQRGGSPGLGSRPSRPSRSSRPSRMPGDQNPFNHRTAIRRKRPNGSMQGFTSLGRGWSPGSALKLSQTISSLSPKITNITKLKEGLSRFGTLYNQEGTKRILKPLSSLGYAEIGALTKLAKSSGFNNAQQLHSVLGAGRTNLINQLKARQQAQAVLPTADSAEKVLAAKDANAANSNLAAARKAAQNALVAFTAANPVAHR